MAYFEPYIDDSGYHYPTYADIRAYLVSQAQTIFGNDIYVDEDSMDGQDISLRAKAMYDTFVAGEFSYNNSSVSSAIGTGLSTNVLLNGISRNSATYSTAYLKVTGTAYTVITNGIVTDAAGYKWDLPASITISSGGTVYATATCETIGAITALANTITTISTPVYGWTSVTNEAPASPGVEVETDGELRIRQAESVALPSQGLLAGTEAAILAVSGVTQCIVKENDTSSSVVVDGLTLPAHSITAIVEGGATEDISNVIFYKKNQGCYTNGDVETVVYDEYDNANTIRFYRPQEIFIAIQVTVDPITGYSSTITDEIETNLYNYINDLSISKDVYRSVLYSIVNNSNTDLKNPYFSISQLTLCISGGTPATDDIIILLNEVAVISTDDITITVTGGSL